MQITHLTQDELAARLHLKPGTLRQWRVYGKGPRYIKLSRQRVLYPIVEVQRWEAEHLQSNTAEGLK